MSDIKLCRCDLTAGHEITCPLFNGAVIHSEQPDAHSNTDPKTIARVHSADPGEIGKLANGYLALLAEKAPTGICETCESKAVKRADTMREALQDMQKAVEELLAEAGGKRATNWAIVNDACVKAGIALKEET